MADVINLWGRIMRIVKFVAVLAAAVLLSVPAAQAEQVCPRGMVVCLAGGNGQGGCYKMGEATCIKGKICGRKEKFCKPGPWGPGGCYPGGFRTCSNGMVCEMFTHFCPPGKKGKGGCYKPGKTCDDGLIK